MTTRPCPICRKPAAQEFRPFCSRRCAQIDLQRWFSGGYAVPASSDDDDQPQTPDAADG